MTPRESSHPGASGVYEQVVVTRDDEVGDLVDLAHGFLRLLDVVCVGEDLAGKEVLLRRHGVSREDGGAGGELDEEAAGAGGVAGEGEEVEHVGDLVVGGGEGVQEAELLAE